MLLLVAVQAASASQAAASTCHESRPVCTCGPVLQPLHESLRTVPARLWQAAVSAGFIATGCCLKDSKLQSKCTELSNMLHLQLQMHRW